MANLVEIVTTSRNQAGPGLDAAKRQATGLGASVQRVGEIAQGIIAAQMFEKIGQSAQRFLGNARTASSDLGESMNAVNVTFKDSAAGILEIGKTADSSMGLSQNAFNAAAVRFSAFAEAVAGPGGDVTKTIQDITQRSSDFASVMNLDVNEAMQIFQSGLAGESEPLRRYGIDVSAAAVQTFAYANGVAEAGAELTEAQKIQARYGLIMEQTSDAAGDFANTSDSLANSQRILAAEMENAQAIVGGLMVPALAALNNLLIPMVQAFSDAPQPIQIVVGGLVLLGAGVLTVTSRIAPMIIAMQAAGLSAADMGTKVRTAATSTASLRLGVVGLAAALSLGLEATVRRLNPNVEALAVGLDRWAKTGRASGEAAKLLGDDFDKLDQALVSAADEGFTRVTATIAEGLIPTTKNMDDSLARGVERVRAMDSALANLVQSGQAEDAAGIFQVLAERAEANGISQEKLAELLPEYAAAQESANESTEDAAGAQEGAAEATDSHTNSLEALAEELRAQTDPMFAFTKAQNDLRDAQKAVTEAEKDHGRKSPEYQDALRGEAEAAIAVLDAAGALGDEFTGRLSSAQRKMLKDAGLSDAAIRRLEKDLKDAKREAGRLDGTRIRITTTELRITQHQNVFLAPSGSRRQAVAQGGIIGASSQAQAGGPRGMDVLVGEQGPEIAQLPLGTRVIPSGQSMAMLRAGSYSREEFTAREWRLLMSGGVAAYMRRWDEQFGRRASAAHRELERQRVANTLELLQRSRAHPITAARASTPTPTGGGGQVTVHVQVLLDGREVRARTRETILELNRTDPAFRSALVGGRR